MSNKKRIIQWTNSILHEISELDHNKGIQILHQCGVACSKSSRILKNIVKIRNEHEIEDDFDKLFHVFKENYYNTERLSKRGNKIILVFEECSCPLAKAGLDNSYLCNCTLGYTKNIFETLFDKPVEVELVKTILRGDQICKQIISITQ